MQPIKKFLEASFRTKVLVPVVAVMALLLAVTVFIVNQQFKSQAQQNARHELAADAGRFQNELARHQHYLRLRFRSLAAEPKYRAALEMSDAQTIHDQLGRMMNEEGLSEENVEFVAFMPTRAFSI